MTQKQRLFFIDMYRGLAVLVMIEGHVSNSTILSSIQKTKTFHYLDLLNGMVAPSFIFMAGFAFTLGLGRKWDDLLSGGKTLWLQVRRLLFVIAVGYWLHLPTWSLRGMLRMSRESWIYFYRADVLQIIGISLLTALLIALILRSKKGLIMTLLILAVAIVLVTPFLQDINPLNYLPAPIAAYINYQNGGFTLFYAPWSYHHYADPARSSPRFFVLRLGFVLMVLSTLWFYEQKLKPQKSILSITGQESLFIYAFHLLIVYGSVFVPYSIARNIGPNLTYLPSFLISALVISLMIVCGFVWHKLKEERPVLAKRIFYSLCAIYFLRFFLT